ncbi:hypothetical protein CUN63_12495 [Pseudomonas sp. ACM7]|nr:hypothetical protein CUN63_12495 [Pseudomonas sp. ACM7]
MGQRFLGSWGNSSSAPTGWVCKAYADEDESAYAYCKFCGDDYVYRSSEINHRGECTEHDGESVYDDEELEDMASLGEYFQNH